MIQHSSPLDGDDGDDDDDDDDDNDIDRHAEIFFSRMMMMM